MGILWHACDRTGLTADFLRALIRLAASGVKAREGTLAGVERHAAAAKTLFEEIAPHLGGDHPITWGCPRVIFASSRRRRLKGKLTK